MSYGSKQSDLRAAESEKNRAGVRVSMPVKVLAFYPDKMTVDVQPLVKESIDGQYASAAPLMGLRVACLCAGEFTIRPWYKRGDVGWVIVSDFDADAVLQTDAPESSLLRVTRLVLCPAENGATLYLQDANQGFFVSRTAISSATLREALASLDGNGTDFAFSLSGEFSQLSPYTLIFSEPPQRYTLSASNALTDQAAFLRLAEFNPHTESGYTDSSGSTIIKEVYGTLRLEPDGSVFYQGADEAEAGSIYYVSAASTGKPTMLEAVAGAQRLAFTLLRDVSGDAELYLSEIDSSNKRFTVSFDYAVGGTPLRFSDGSHAATVTIEDQTITEFSLHCRSYTLSDSPALLLPIRQAAAIADSKYLSAELHVCYDEHGADTVGVGWFAD